MEEMKISITEAKAEWMRIAEILMIASDELDLRNGTNSVLAMKLAEISNDIKTRVENA